MIFEKGEHWAVDFFSSQSSPNPVSNYKGPPEHCRESPTNSFYSLCFPPKQTSTAYLRAPKANGSGLIALTRPGPHRQGTPASWHPEYCLEGWACVLDGQRWSGRSMWDPLKSKDPSCLDLGWTLLTARVPFSSVWTTLLASLPHTGTSPKGGHVWGHHPAAKSKSICFPEAVPHREVPLLAFAFFSGSMKQK